LVLAVGLRAAAQVWSTLADCLPEALRETPHWTTGRQWLVRVGYYKLTRPKPQASDWVWIVDHTVQAGRLKCLVLLGIRLADLPPPGEHLALRHLEPLGVVPMSCSNGDTVLAQLERHTRVTGTPCAILSDHGADLWAGIQRFCQRHPGVHALYDVAHKAASLLKSLLEKDSRWGVFSKQTAVAKRQVHQTEMSGLAPPMQRSKARYMNLGPLLDWAHMILWALEKHPAAILRHCTAQRLEAKLGWVREYRGAIRQWQQWREMTEVGVQLIRNGGLTLQTPHQLQARLQSLTVDSSGQWLEEQLMAFAQEQTRELKPHERFPGTSEVIESCFGKQKVLSGEQSQGGFTSLLPALGALVGPLDEELVRVSLEQTPGKVIRDWCQSQLGVTPQSQRQAAFAAHRQAQENAEDPITVST
jgi:hypothetical protein